MMTDPGHIRVLVADDHAIVRKGICALLSTDWPHPAPPPRRRLRVPLHPVERDRTSPR